MSVFEVIMLLCFGAAWPVSIVKSLRTRRTGGKSFVFLVIVMVGYVSGIIHKLLYSRDFIVGMYALNLTMVFIDSMIWLRNRKLETLEQGAGAGRP